jgi:hypothetical protein
MVQAAKVDSNVVCCLCSAGGGRVGAYRWRDCVGAALQCGTETGDEHLWIKRGENGQLSVCRTAQTPFISETAQAISIEIVTFGPKSQL